MAGRPKLHGDKDRLIPPDLRAEVLAYLESEEGRTKHGIARMAILLADQAGLRVSEICKLTAADCDIARQPFRLLVRGSKHRRADQVDEQPIGPYLAGELNTWLVVNGIEGNVTVLKGAPEPYSRQYVGQLVKAVHEACELPAIYAVHSWRHGYGTRVYLKTKDLVFTSRMLRHRSTKPTERYVHMATAMEEMGEVFEAIEDMSGAPRKLPKQSRKRLKKTKQKARDKAPKKGRKGTR